jgi:hypothetical protein
MYFYLSPSHFSQSLKPYSQAWKIGQIIKTYIRKITSLKILNFKPDKYIKEEFFRLNQLKSANKAYKWKEKKKKCGLGWFLFYLKLITYYPQSFAIYSDYN